MPVRRAPNTRLRALLRHARWSGQKLADAVNAAGAESGMDLRYDRTSVAHWLSGTRPSVAVATLVAEVLSRHLGRRVEVAETGLTGGGWVTGQRASQAGGVDAVAHLVRLGGSRALRRVIYTTAAADLPDLVEPVAAHPPAARPPERVGAAQARAAELMLSVFSEADFAFGAGRALPALRAYLATDVASWLRATATPTARARLRSAAARLAYLAGWMCFDDNAHGAGQRYYRIAARLAMAGGDAGCYAAALRGLSVQAHYLGHHHVARDLAEAAVRESGQVPRFEAAFLTGQLAVASAACGDRRAALASLAEAERILDQAAVPAAAVGGYHVAALHHQRGETLAWLGNSAAAIQALAASLRHRPPTERRARAVTAARLAGLYLDTGRLELACAAWSRLLDDRPQLASGRVEHAVRSMRARLRPHGRHPGARALLRRASAQPRVSW